MKKFYLKQMFAALLLFCSTMVCAATYSDWTSTNTANNSTSDYTYTIKAEAGSQLSFDWAVSSERTYDKLVVTLNGTTILEKSGEDSGNYAYNFTTSGTYTLYVKYTKDYSYSEGGDYGKIYNITVTEAITGTCGNNLNWRLVGGTLTITGQGEMQASNRWYELRDGIKKVIIEEGATNIDYGAFDGCDALKSITIPASVTKIEQHAFTGCTSLEELNILDGENILDLSYGDWEGETGLFLNCPLKIVYLGRSLRLENTYPDLCPFRSQNISTLTVGKYVTHIGNGSFYGCKIKYLNIKDFAAWCKINFCDNALMANAEEVFVNSIQVSSLNISADITTISNNAIHGPKFSSIKVDSNNPNYDSREGCNAIIEKETSTLIAGCNYTVIPQSVKAIADYAFYKSTITKINLPDSLTSIGYCAFSDCGNLTSITIPNGVTSIGDCAFSACGNLTSVTIGNGVTSIGNWAFGHCSSLTSITIPNSVTSIGDYAFYECRSLVSVTIGNSVTSIGEDAFTGYMPSFKRIYINDLAAWCKIDFANEYSNPLYQGRNLYLNDELVTDLVIPESITEIKKYSFNFCWSITNVTLGKNIKRIGYEAFYNCNNLTTFTSHIPAEGLSSVTPYYFINVNSNCTLYVPYRAGSTYSNQSYWRGFKKYIEMPFDLTISAARYATLYLDYNAVIPEDVRVYYAEKVEGETLLMERITDVIPANTGVIVTGNAGTYTFEESAEAVAAIENNLFQGSVNDSYITPVKGTKYYVLSMVDGVVGMYRDELADGTFKNNAFKAYLPLSGESLGIFDTTVNAPDVQLSNRYTFNFGGVTAVESIITTASDEAIYNLNGQRVENPTKGIYIVNGKKVIY